MIPEIYNRKKTKRSIAIPAEQLIYGAFINGNRVIQQSYGAIFSIKLSSITMIAPIDDDWEREECLFYTYKDCCYYVPISCSNLKKAINSFIFDAETHWESYGLLSE